MNGEHFTPFGIVFQNKIWECDRAIESAVVGSGDIKKLTADRKALEYLLNKESNLLPKQTDKTVVTNDLPCNVLKFCLQHPTVTTNDVLVALGYKLNNRSMSTQIGCILRRNGWSNRRLCVNNVQVRTYINPKARMLNGVYTLDNPLPIR